MSEANEPKKSEEDAEAERLAGELFQKVYDDAMRLAAAGSTVTLETEDDAFHREISVEGSFSLFRGDGDTYHILQSVQGQWPISVLTIISATGEDKRECRAICGFEKRLLSHSVNTGVVEETLPALNAPVCQNCFKLWKENPKRAALCHRESKRKGQFPPYEWTGTVILERQGEE